jgi:hypothetical protein
MAGVAARVSLPFFQENGLYTARKKTVIERFVLADCRDGLQGQCRYRDDSKRTQFHIFLPASIHAKSVSTILLT